MIHGYINDGKTYIVACNDSKEFGDLILKFEKNQISNIKSHQILTSLDMMMDDEFSHLINPIIIVEHDNNEQQLEFTNELDIKLSSLKQSLNLQEIMQKNSERLKEREDERMNKLKAEMSGESYILPSIEEIYGLNIVDPWKPKEEEKQKYMNDESIMEETSFGDANEQRRARDELRMKADPSYKPIRFMGQEKDKEDDIDIHKILLQKKSEASKKLENPVTTTEEDLNEEVEFISEESSYLENKYEDNKKIRLEDIQKDHNKMTSKASFRLNEYLKIKFDALPSQIKNKIKDICDSSKVETPEFINEYWYQNSAKFDDYYVLPEDTSKDGINIKSGTNIDFVKSITVSFNGPSTRMIKKVDPNKEALVLYSKESKIEDKTIVEFFVVRLK